MLHILLMILKIAGIILAVILGILVLLVCIVLFVPICYRGEVGSEGGLKDIRAHGQVSWLFGFVKAVVDVRNKSPDIYIKIAWKKIGGRSESIQEEEEKKDEEVKGYGKEKSEEFKKAGKERREGREKASGDGEKESALGEKKIKESIDGGKEFKECREGQEKYPEDFEGYKECEYVPEEKFKLQKEVGEDAAQGHEEGQEEHEESAYGRAEKLSFSGKIAEKFQGFIRKIRQTVDKFKCTIQRLCDRIEETSEKKDKLKAFIADAAHRNAFGRGKKELIKLLGRLSPKVLQADIHYGFEDPSLTGRVLAGFGILYPFLGDNVQITPDFQEKILEGKLYVKGRIYVRHLAVTAVKLLLDGDVRRTIKDIRKFKL